eukprot:ANDGO_05908.mRNA.1 Protein farnesyltransferase subunit beta
MSRSDDGYPTETSNEQLQTESRISAFLSRIPQTVDADKHKVSETLDEMVRKHFYYAAHEAYLYAQQDGTSERDPPGDSFDSLQPWLCYWSSHALNIFKADAFSRDENVTDSENSLRKRLIRTLSRCFWCVREVDTHGSDRLEWEHVQLVNDYVSAQSEAEAEAAAIGSFGGGNTQLGHLAPTYAAVLSLASAGKECLDELLRIRLPLLRFLAAARTCYHRHKQQEESFDSSSASSASSSTASSSSGSFRMHFGGESDMRAAYCAVTIATILGVSMESGIAQRLFEGTAEWILSCQTYEGGFGAIPGAEAHGGYTFCALAALTLLGVLENPDVVSCERIERCKRWLVSRQYAVEGGFSGRTNKLVDACYAWWIGASLVLTHSHDLIDRPALFRYVLGACQPSLPGKPVVWKDLDGGGGFRDKPGKRRDLYHTCYALSGISVLQYAGSDSAKMHADSETASSPYSLYPTDPAVNIRTDRLNQTRAFWSQQPPLSLSDIPLLLPPA